MSIFNILGLNGYTKVGERKAWNRDSGRTTIFDYEGPREPTDVFMESLVNDPAVDGLQFGSIGGVGTLSVTYVDDDGTGGGTTTPQDNELWEFIGQDLFKSIKAHPTFNTTSPAGVQDTLEAARLYFRTAQQQGSAPSGAPATTYYELLLRGTDEYVRSAAILRQTLLVGARSTTQANWEGVDRAWKFDSEPGSPDMPTAGQQVIIGSVESMDDFFPSLRQWLKRAPTITQAGRRRFRIQTEWWFARNWSEVLYSGTNINGENP